MKLQIQEINFLIFFQLFNLDLYEPLIQEIFQKIYVQSKDYSILIAKLFNQKKNFKVLEILFKNLEVPILFTNRYATLATFSTGLILEMGASFMMDTYYTFQRRKIYEPFKQYVFGEYNSLKNTCQIELLTYQKLKQIHLPLLYEVVILQTFQKFSINYKKFRLYYVQSQISHVSFKSKSIFSYIYWRLYFSFILSSFQSLKMNIMGQRDLALLRISEHIQNFCLCSHQNFYFLIIIIL